MAMLMRENSAGPNSAIRYDEFGSAYLRCAFANSLSPGGRMAYQRRQAQPKGRSRAAAKDGPNRIRRAPNSPECSVPQDHLIQQFLGRVAQHACAQIKALHVLVVSQLAEQTRIISARISASASGPDADRSAGKYVRALVGKGRRLEGSSGHGTPRSATRQDSQKPTNLPGGARASSSPTSLSRTRSGLPTLPTSAPMRGGCTWQWYHAKWSVGR
jgi:hypothetical protein